MTVERTMHPAILWMGWIALLGGLALPLGVSIAAFAVYRNPSCITVVWSFAPLLIGCEPIGSTYIAYGWFGTCLTLALLATAIVAAGASIRFAVTANPGRRRADAIHLALTVTIAGVLAAYVLVAPPLPGGGADTWMLSCSAAAMTASALSLLILGVRAARHGDF